MADINFGAVAYVLGILSIVFAFVSQWGIGGLIIGIIGFIQAKKYNVQKAKRLNIIGIILSAIMLIINIIFVVLLINSGADSGSFPLF